MKSRRKLLLQVIGVLAVFVIAFVATGLLPVMPLHQGNAMIGRLPLFLVWYPSHPRNWTGEALHLLLSATLTSLFLLAWGRFCSNNWRFGLRTLLLAMTLIAILIAVFTVLFRRTE